MCQFEYLIRTKFPGSRTFSPLFPSYQYLFLTIKLWFIIHTFCSPSVLLYYFPNLLCQVPKPFHKE